MRRGEYEWPKRPPPLSAAQEQAREAFVMAWHEELPFQYTRLEQFNHGYVAALGTPPGTRTLEIGAGIGGHLPFEDLTAQEYHALEYRVEFCERLATQLPPDRVHHGNIEERQPFPDGSFDRIIAIHVLEHLRDLPAALTEITRLLRPGGIFDVVLPTEGGFAYGLARKVSAERMFERRFGMDYTPIIRSEHVNTYAEVTTLLRPLFRRVHSRYFPLRVPSAEINLIVGERLSRPAS
jgi:SAM-dependent methyltransferase